MYTMWYKVGICVFCHKTFGKYIEYNILLLKIVLACFTNIVNIIYWPVTTDWKLAKRHCYNCTYSVSFVIIQINKFVI